MVTATDATTAPRLSIRNASKTFGRVRVLHEVALDVLPGEIHGLVGQNGSGKSTLIKLLSGVYAPDAGADVRIDGAAVPMPASARELQKHGIAFVHQDLGLDLDASVVQNVRIGHYEAGRFTRRIRWRAEATHAARALATLGATSINPYATVRTLRHAERASVAIARALQGIALGTGLIVLDESTQSLPRDILRELYAQVRAIAASGTSVLMVSHRLDEILALCSKVTVLEDGRATVVGESTEGLSEADLTRLILGKSASAYLGGQSLKTESARRGKEALAALELAGSGLKGASFQVFAGEVVGVIGTSDSAYDVLPYVLAGSLSASEGALRIDGVELALRSLTPATVTRSGLCLVPGSRLGQGLAADMTALENLTLPRLHAKGGRFALRRGWQLSEFADAIRSLGLSPPSPDLRLGAFSGGNQQKLLLAKWLGNKPRVLVVHEPTQAVDVGARQQILLELRRQASQGVAVLVSSLETTDLATVCDRVLVMQDGRVVHELTDADVEPHTIIDAVYTGISSEIAHATA
ncbi:sugar ABC transporter ATP-binding protein [Nonomuraea monospora]|uniref:Autoinducer 2 import ATP-binding protein LsrA n=1 Tax=Nonomuraea monospora TaxID=568818 RepID=A0ABN3D369_9ACTN